MRRSRSRFLFGAALALAACDSRTPSITGPDAVPAGQTTAALRDAGIVTSDSWLAADVTTTSDGTSNTVQVEAGYGSSGELRFGMYWTPTIPSVSLSGIRYIGDRVEMIGRRGAVIGTSSFNGHATDVGLPGGTLVHAMLASQDPGDTPCQPSDPDCLATLRDESAVRAAAPSPDERRVRRRMHPARTTVALSGEGDYADIERVYRRQRQPIGAPDLWRLEEIVEERRATTNSGAHVSRTTTKIRYTRYQVKPEREALRVAAFRAAPAVRSAPGAEPTALSAMPVAGEDADGLLDAFCAPGTRNDHVHHRKQPELVYSIIYLHGFCSDAAVWDGFRPRIAAALPVLRERAYSRNTTIAIEQQVTELTALIAEAGPTRNIVIGHSQGGLVARRFGQVAPEYVSSVITIGSPQWGALLAALGPQGIAELSTHITSRMCVTWFLCGLVDAIIEEQLNGAFRLLLLSDGGPALDDMQPGSEFLTRLNSTFEPFARASVETEVGNRWAIARAAGDARSPVKGLLAGQRPAGDAWVTQAELVYRSAQALWMLSAFVLYQRESLGNGVNCAQSGYLTYWSPCSSGSTTEQGLSWFQEILALNTLLVAAIVMEGMNAIDGAWDYATTRRQPGTDGLIHSYSQRYPDAPGAFAPARYRVDRPEADSHFGQLASPSTLQRTLDALRAVADKNP
jgi:pimeloyl-ACP methyl ester carboxylesterase